MPTNVLVLATRHDASSSHTFQWALELQKELFRYSDNCFFLDVTGLCRNGSVLADLVQTATHVVFYGHGEHDQWVAFPGTPPTALIDTNTVAVLNQREVYAGCCWSLTTLGQAFASQCGGNYIGYDHQFGFEVENEQEFKDIVKQSVINFVTSGNPLQVISNLQQQWKRLSHDFVHGVLTSRPNAVHAGFLADLNSQRVGKRP